MKAIKILSFILLIIYVVLNFLPNFKNYYHFIFAMSLILLFIYQFNLKHEKK